MLAKDRWNLTPLDDAKRCGHLKAVSILEGQEAKGSKTHEAPPEPEQRSCGEKCDDTDEQASQALYQQSEQVAAEQSATATMENQYYKEQMQRLEKEKKQALEELEVLKKKLATAQS